MRAFVLLLMLAILVVIAAIMTGYLNFTNLRGAPPELTATRNSVTLKGGRAPSFDVEAGSVKIGTRPTTVNVPVLKVQKPEASRSASEANNLM
jgi:hypothetical protein